MASLAWMSHRCTNPPSVNTMSMGFHFAIPAINVSGRLSTKPQPWTNALERMERMNASTVQYSPV
jgi:hypothetical protein